MIGGTDRWFNSKGGQTYNYSGSFQGTRRCSYGHYDPKTRVLQLEMRCKSQVPVDYKATSKRMKYRFKELFKPERYIFSIDECYCRGGFNYIVQFFARLDQPSEDTMSKVRDITNDIVEEDMEDYLERRRLEKLAIERKSACKIKKSKEKLYI